MASIIQGTDSDVVVSIGSDLDLHTVEWFSIRIVQGSLYLEKTKEDLFLDYDNREIHVPISKEESMRFSATAANLQVLYGLDGSSKTRGTYSVPFRIYPLLQPIHVDDTTDDEVSNNDSINISDEDGLGDDIENGDVDNG